MNTSGRRDENEKTHEPNERPGTLKPRGPTERLGLKDLIDMGRVSEETHGGIGNHFEGFVPKP